MLSISSSSSESTFKLSCNSHSLANTAAGGFLDAAGVIFSELEKTLNVSRGQLVQCQTLIEVQQATQTDSEDKFVEVMAPFAEIAEKKLLKSTDGFNDMKARFKKLFNRFGGDFSAMEGEKDIAAFWTSLWNFSLAIESAKAKNKQMDVLAEKNRVKEEKARLKEEKAAKKLASQAKLDFPAPLPSPTTPKTEVKAEAAAAPASQATTFQQYENARRGRTAKELLKAKQANRMSVRGGGMNVMAMMASQAAKKPRKKRKVARRKPK